MKDCGAFDYTVRVSQRARRARIVVRPGGMIEVVLPKGVPHRQVPAMLQARQGWLRSAVLRMREAAPLLDRSPPARIKMPACGRIFDIEYRPCADTGLILRQQASRLLFNGPVHDEDAVNARLREWLKQQGREYLPPLLAERADAMGVDYRRVSVRLQKTRWGSCSVRGNISLNARLLLLPLPLVRYVLVHELAHLREHNHSPAFWRQVARFEPDYRHLRGELIEAGRRLPGWLQP